MLESPGFSDFRPLMEMWDEYLAEQKVVDDIKRFMDMQGLVLFFRKGKEYFGTDEDNRLVFSKLKRPDGDENDGWCDEASFTASNLTKMICGEASQSVFAKKDIRDIKVKDRDTVAERLKAVAEKNGGFSPLKVARIDISPANPPGDAPNFHRTDER